MSGNLAIVGALVAGMVVATPTTAPAQHSAASLGVVFERVTSGGNSDVIATNEAGKPQRNLTADDTSNDASPALSPNGRTIVFTSDRKTRFALWAIDRNGRGLRQLVASTGADVNPSFSPNGRWIAFTCKGVGGPDICVTTSSGKKRRNLTHDSATELDATWSPDSTRIVFDRIDAKGESDIWSVGASGTGLKDLTPESPLGELDPTMSKTGDLAFDAIDPKGNYDVYVQKAGSSTPTRLTSDPGEDSAPVYSPDGTRLLFVSDRTGDYEIFEMNADGTGQRDLSKDPGVADIAPNFGPPGASPEATFGRPMLPAGQFPCAQYGTTGNDDGVDHPVLNGNDNQNRLCARDGDDIVHGWGAKDLIDGGRGNDTMYGDAGNDTIYARAGSTPDSDTIWGGTGSDTAIYDPDNDSHDPHDICHCEDCRTTS